ncbi:MAG: CapA family protein [Lachnospiraceae bacterium]|nr:MAG: CapA family protein [Lachnospiraceae bacterium]
MKIIIGADFVPTKNEKYFINADWKYLIGEDLRRILEESDYRIFNLEVPLCTNKTPIVKYGPNLMASTDSVALFKALKIDLFTLGNNHIMDQGEDGLKSTMKTLSEAKISFVGAGKSKIDASKSFIVERNEFKLGIYACAEHEFSCADYNKAGANPYDPLETYEQIYDLKEHCNYVIVLYHGGKEHYRYPSPDLQKICRKFIDKGADLVVCQHSHCIGCEEKYNNGTIVYGQGNFLFDRSDIDEWKTSLLIAVENGNVSYIPLKKQDDKVRLASKIESEQILQGFMKRSLEIKNKEKVNTNYNQFTSELIYDYLWTLSGAGKSIVLRFINRMSGYKFCKKYLDKKYNQASILAILNYFECEAHREVIINALKNKVYRSEEDLK